MRLAFTTHSSLRLSERYGITNLEVPLLIDASRLIVLDEAYHVYAFKFEGRVLAVAIRDGKTITTVFPPTAFFNSGWAALLPRSWYKACLKQVPQNALKGLLRAYTAKLKEMRSHGNQALSGGCSSGGPERSSEVS